VSDEIKKKELFEKGLSYYKGGDYFEAHEYWEDLWSDFYLEDRKFIQGLIQLAVSFVHLGNGNIKGAKSLLSKSKEKFLLFSGIHRNINVVLLLQEIERVGKSYNELENSNTFNWAIVPSLK